MEPTQENLTSWIKAGVFCVGMGSKLFPGDKVAAEDWAYVTAKLSLIHIFSKVAPPKYKGAMMGLWFVATAIGNYQMCIRDSTYTAYSIQ